MLYPYHLTSKGALSANEFRMSSDNALTLEPDASGGLGRFLSFGLMNGSAAFLGRGGATGRLFRGGLCKMY